MRLSTFFMDLDPENGSISSVRLRVTGPKDSSKELAQMLPEGRNIFFHQLNLEKAV